MKVNLVDAMTIAEQDALPVPGNRHITAKWTGRYPCLCDGEWIITVGDEKVDLPDEVRTSPMDTRRIYNSWSFDKDHDEVWSCYETGLYFEPWLQKNSWISSLGLSHKEERALYDAISKEDWRHGSCGGLHLKMTRRCEAE